MITIKIQDQELPFVFGISVSEEFKTYKKQEQKPDYLKEYLRWQKDCKDEGLDISQVTFDQWKENQPLPIKNTLEDDIMLYHISYCEGCRRTKKVPLSFEEFKALIDSDYKENLKLIANTIVELAGTGKEDEESKSTKNG